MGITYSRVQINKFYYRNVAGTDFIEKINKTDISTDRLMRTKIEDENDRSTKRTARCYHQDEQILKL